MYVVQRWLEYSSIGELLVFFTMTKKLVVSRSVTKQTVIVVALDFICVEIFLSCVLFLWFVCFSFAPMHLVLKSMDYRI